MTQNEIIQGCKKGDEGAYRFLVDAYADQLMGICVRYLRDHQKAEDSVQETFIQVFKSIHTFDGKGSLPGWMCKIAVNCCLKELRKSKRLSFTEEDTVFDQLVEWPEVYDKLNAEDIMAMLEQVSISYRMVFLMHVVDGYTLKDIASRLDITEGGVKTLYYKARQKMREILNKNGYNYESTSNKK